MYLEDLGFCDRASWANCEVREKTNKMQQLDVYYQHFLNMFRGIIMPIFRWTKTVCYCMWCAALLQLDVVGSGCGALRCRMRAPWRLLFDSFELGNLSRTDATSFQMIRAVHSTNKLVQFRHWFPFCRKVAESMNFQWNSPVANTVEYAQV